MNDNIYEIKSIIFWLRQIDEYKKVVKFFDNHSNTNGVIVSKKTTFLARCEAYHVCNEIELDGTVTMGMYDYLKNRISHMEKLVEAEDPDLVEIAKEIYSGELNKKGFDFV